MEDKKDFFKKLKETLDETTTFPTKYMYKFIVPADKGKEDQINEIFNFTGAVINIKKSKTGKFSSVSIVLNVSSSEDVIEKYEKVAKIEGVISL